MADRNNACQFTSPAEMRGKVNLFDALVPPLIFRLIFRYEFLNFAFFAGSSSMHNLSTPNSVQASCKRHIYHALLIPGPAFNVPLIIVLFQRGQWRFNEQNPASLLCSGKDGSFRQKTSTSRPLFPLVAPRNCVCE